MSGTVGRALMTAAVLAIGASPARAQRLIPIDSSVGGMVTAYGPAGGLYLDGGLKILPSTSVIGEIQVFQSNATEFLALGGVRQRLYDSSQGELFVQLLFGGATGYLRRCDLCRARATELGLGANVALSDHWAVRVRGDIRVGGSAGDLLYPMLGAGVTRTWGRR